VIFGPTTPLITLPLMHAVFDRPLTLDETKQLRLPVIGGLLAGMNHNHPFTSDARIYFYTTPISPTVMRVPRILVRPKGEPPGLFEGPPDFGPAGR
jgi:hypothetical protein